MTSWSLSPSPIEQTFEYLEMTSLPFWASLPLSNNLTVEDMGGGDGWRVKDHDNVLHLFDNESDARNGKLVLAKYSKNCSIGDNDGYDAVNFML